MPVKQRAEGEDCIGQRDQYDRGGIGRAYWDHRDRVALSMLEPTDREIVDLGCGEGVTLEKVTRLFPGSRVVGIDMLEENVAICERHGLAARVGDVYALDLQDESADAVLFNEVVEHLDDPARAIREIHRVLKPGGKLSLVFPNDIAFLVARVLTLKFREARFDPGHVRQWTPRHMRRLLTAHGFTVEWARAIPLVAWPVSLHCVVSARKRA